VTQPDRTIYNESAGVNDSGFAKDDLDKLDLIHRLHYKNNLASP